MGKRAVYVQKMKAQLDAMNDRLQAIEAQAHEPGEEVRAIYGHEMAQLRTDARAAGAHLDEIRAASEDGWHKRVSEMERLRHAFTNSLRCFKSPL